MKLTTQLGIVATAGLTIVGLITGTQGAFVAAGAFAILTILDYVFSAPELPEAVAPAPVAAEPAPAKKTTKKATTAKKAPVAKATAPKKAAPAKKTAAKKTAKK